MHSRNPPSRPHWPGDALLTIWLGALAGDRIKTWKAAAKMMADAKKDAPASGEQR